MLGLLCLTAPAGLLKSDFHLDAERPFVRIQRHPWRDLKTLESARDVPLSGASLWAARRIMEVLLCVYLLIVSMVEPTIVDII